MKRIKLLLVFSFCLTLIGCGRIYGPVEEVKAFINEKEDVILQISKKIEADPSEAGVDEARKVFDARKDGLKAQREAIRKKPQGLNSDWRVMLSTSVVNDNNYFNAIRSKSKLVLNDAADKKFMALEKAFKEATRGQLGSMRKK